MNQHELNKNQRKESKTDNQVLKEMRQLRRLTRKEAGQLFFISESTLKRREHESYKICSEELSKFIHGYGFSQKDFLNIKLSKFDQIQNLDCTKKIKIIEHNELRRSYQRIITKEVKALTLLRERKGINKHQASKLCGYHRTTIGHLERGRITLTDKRIRHILTCYGSTYKDFKSIVESKIDRTEIEKQCLCKLQKLSDEKLMTLRSLLKSF